MKRMILYIEPYYSIWLEDSDVTVTSCSKHAKGRKLKAQYTVDGYQRYKINNAYRSSHSMVTEAFLGIRPKDLTVNHIDGDKLNNSKENLEYITRTENIKHAVKLGLHVASDPKRSGRYKDGRCADIKAYKRQWYLNNKGKTND